MPELGVTGVLPEAAGVLGLTETPPDGRAGEVTGREIVERGLGVLAPLFAAGVVPATVAAGAEPLGLAGDAPALPTPGAAVYGFSFKESPTGFIAVGVPLWEVMSGETCVRKRDDA